ncbi:hypothetical protein VTK73DRAFT_8771 [Phialemonium thermophilum]|uniref:Zn(2)-C6 fungal-type domain-containing protein n=1 Tax=Phialemonium thermophilum TaxID=223376 RepID=A0ABR3XNW5_9PEZI
MMPSNHRHPVHPSRHRVRTACEPCKARKRKCDGHEPCGTCVRYEYECAYAPHHGKSITGSSKLKSSREPTKGMNSDWRLPPSAGRAGDLDQRHMEANSGVAFPHFLGRDLNLSDAVKVRSVGWNLGLSDESTEPRTNPTTLLTQSDMERLANVYFEKVHPVYGFLNEAALRSQITARWNSTSCSERYDGVLCGVAALGSLFSGVLRTEPERQIFKCSEELLEIGRRSRKPMLDDAAAHLLHTIYLRATSSPHAAWMASCTTMHLLEAVGAHQERTSISLLYSDTADTTSMDQEGRRRLFWISTVLNAWISYEYGRSRIALRGVSCEDPSAEDGNFTVDLVNLYRISELLDPHNLDEPPDLEECLARIERLELSHDALILSRSNLTLTIYRRMRLGSSTFLKDFLDRIIQQGLMGLEAALRMAEASCPWWHVINLPFQLVCVFLAIDTKEALSWVSHAIHVLRVVAQRFNTHAARAALETAESLVRLSRKQKEQQATILRQSLGEQDETEIARNNSVFLSDGYSGQAAAIREPDGQNGLTWDWDTFFNMDIPVFADLGVINETNSQML